MSRKGEQMHLDYDFMLPTPIIAWDSQDQLIQWWQHTEFDRGEWRLVPQWDNAERHHDLNPVE